MVKRGLASGPRCPGLCRADPPSRTFPESCAPLCPLSAMSLGVGPTSQPRAGSASGLCPHQAPCPRRACLWDTGVCRRGDPAPPRPRRQGERVERETGAGASSTSVWVKPGSREGPEGPQERGRPRQGSRGESGEGLADRAGLLGAHRTGRGCGRGQAGAGASPGRAWAAAYLLGAWGGWGGARPVPWGVRWGCLASI